MGMVTVLHSLAGWVVSWSLVRSDNLVEGEDLVAAEDLVADEDLVGGEDLMGGEYLEVLAACYTVVMTLHLFLIVITGLYATALSLQSPLILVNLQQVH